MSNVIQINFDEVPDKFEQVPAGVYTCTIEKCSKERTKDGTGDKVVVEMKISEDGPFFGRGLYDHIGLKGKPIQLKRLIKAAGLTPDGAFDLEDLVGQTVKLRTKIRTYKDAESGEMKETSSIGDYLIPGE